MTRNHIACLALVMAGLFCAFYPALAEDAISHPAKKPIGPSSNEMIPSLAVVNSDGATLQGNKLTLKGVSANSIVFADRPVRAAGHVLTSDFIKEWDEGARELRQGPAERDHLGAEQRRQDRRRRGRDAQGAEARRHRPDLRGLGARGRSCQRDRSCLAVHRSLRRGCRRISRRRCRGRRTSRLARRMVRSPRRGLRHGRGSWSCGRSGGGNAELLCSSGVRLLPLPALLSELLGTDGPCSDQPAAALPPPVSFLAEISAHLSPRLTRLPRHPASPLASQARDVHLSVGAQEPLLASWEGWRCARFHILSHTTLTLIVVRPARSRLL